MLKGQTRQQVASRADNRCEYCRCPDAFVPDDFAVEHIIPRHKGGPDDLSNLAWSCQGCNSRKFTAQSAPDPQTSRRAPLYHPRTQRWQRHFAWSQDSLVVLGKTATGHATIDRLQLNRRSIVNLRRALLAIGQHPPADT